MEVTFAYQSYQSLSLPLDNQRVVNAFLEAQVPGAKSQTPVFGAPGLTRWTTLPKGPVRGMWNFRGVLYAVGGDSLYRLNSAGGAKLLGSGISGTQVVSMSDNGQQLMVVNGVGGYLVDVDGNFQQIQNPNFYSASTVLFFDNYFVFDRKGTNEFFLSGLLDGTSYSGLDFASAEAQPGFLTTVAQNLQLLFLFCQNHIEMWYDAGAEDFPFARYAGGVIERGCISPHTVIQQDDALFFLGIDRVFYRLQGNVPIRISTHAIENAFQQYGDISDAFCFTYTIAGHKMIALTFPSVPHTWEFDISTKLWHERESWDEDNKTLGRWRANCACEIYNKILIGDAVDGTIGYLDWENPTEYGNILQCLLYSNQLHSDKLPIFFDRLELDMETGVGLTTGRGSAPIVMLRYSKDGGRTWSRQQPARSLGKIGEFLKRLRWIQMGRGYQWMFEITITDPVKRVLIGTHADFAVGMR
jgi:hypothetical protein